MRLILPLLQRRTGGNGEERKMPVSYSKLASRRVWSGRRDSNSRLQPWEGCTLPLSYSRADRQKDTSATARISPTAATHQALQPVPVLGSTFATDAVAKGSNTWP